MSFTIFFLGGYYPLLRKAKRRFYEQLYSPLYRCLDFEVIQTREAPSSYKYISIVTSRFNKNEYYFL
jgi:hypothetical protein